MPKLADLKLPPLARKPFSFTRHTRDGKEEQCEVLIQVLTGKEHDLARAEAIRYVNKLIAEEGEKDSAPREDLLTDARIFEGLQFALRDPAHAADDNPPPWCTAMELREKLTPDEVGIIWKAYRGHESAISPFKHDLTKEEFESLVQLAAASASIDPQEFYGTRLRVRVHHLMATEIVMARARVLELEATVESMRAEIDSKYEEEPTPVPEE